MKMLLTESKTLDRIEKIIYDMVNTKKHNIETVMGDNLNSADIVEEIMNKINSLR